MSVKQFSNYWDFLEKQDKKTVITFSLSALGLLLFIAIAITFPFRDTLFQALFPKPKVIAVAIPPSFVQSAIASISPASATVSASWSSPTANGNFLMALLSVNSQTSVNMVSEPSGWTRVTEKIEGDLYQWVYYLPNAPSQSGQVSFTLGSSAKASITLAEFKDVEQANPFDTQNTATGSGTLSSSNITPNGADEFIIAALSTNASTTFASPSAGFVISAQNSTTGGSDASSGLFHYFNSGSSPVSNSVNLDTSSNWIQTLLAFKAAQVLVTPTPTSQPAATTDWPQLQRDAARTGFTTAYTNPGSIRARWIWFGSNWILRNQSSESLPTWDDDLAPGDGKNLSMPATVPFSFAESMQPLIVNGKILVGDSKVEKVWALNSFNGETIWEADNPGGTAWTGVATSSIVVFPSLYGYLTAWDINNGQQLWRVDTGKSISHSPALVGNTIYTANHAGKVYAIDLTSGNILWQTDTGAPIMGGLAVDGGKVFVGNEAMYAISLNASNGQELNRTKVTGQYFNRLWPVITGGRAIFTTAQVHFVGSEYAMNGVIDGSDANFIAEQSTIRNWLQGTGWKFEHLYALDVNDMSKDYVVANGAIGGVGHPLDPPVVNKNGLPITWWPTYFGTISSCAFGCPSGYEIDIAGINLTNGNGVQVASSGTPFFGVETDNTFAFTMGGDVLFMRQQFRGTRAINFATKQSYIISATYRYQDCGGWAAALNYAEGVKGCPPESWTGKVRVPSDTEAFSGHVGPAVTQGMICFTEPYAVTCMEDY